MVRIKARDLRKRNRCAGSAGKAAPARPRPSYLTRVAKTRRVFLSVFGAVLSLLPYDSATLSDSVLIRYKDSYTLTTHTHSFVKVSRSRSVQLFVARFPQSTRSRPHHARVFSPLRSPGPGGFSDLGDSGSRYHHRAPEARRLEHPELGRQCQLCRSRGRDGASFDVSWPYRDAQTHAH